MAKMLNALLFVMIVQVGLIMLTGASAPGGALWALISNPTDWGSLSLVSFLTDTLLVAGVSVIVIGSFFIKSDFLVFAGISSVFLSFGTSLYNLWQYVDSHAALGGGSNGWVAMIFISPIIIMYLIVLLEFWRGTG